MAIHELSHVELLVLGFFGGLAFVITFAVLLYYILRASHRALVKCCRETFGCACCRPGDRESSNVATADGLELVERGAAAEEKSTDANAAPVAPRRAAARGVAIDMLLEDIDTDETRAPRGTGPAPAGHTPRNDDKKCAFSGGATVGSSQPPPRMKSAASMRAAASVVNAWGDAPASMQAASGKLAGDLDAYSGDDSGESDDSDDPQRGSRRSRGRRRRGGGAKVKAANAFSSSGKRSRSRKKRRSSSDSEDSDERDGSRKRGGKRGRSRRRRGGGSMAEAANVKVTKVKAANAFSKRSRSGKKKRSKKKSSRRGSSESDGSDY